MPNLIVVGSGIKSVAHLTKETQHIIKNADKVLYLVNEDYLKAWIEKEAQDAESLESIYFSTTKRIDAYYLITQYILDEYEKVNNLCIIFYGHPTIFAESALNAVKKIKAKKGNAIILPAISTMDCLFSDLLIDPGESGCFTLDATELLLYERTIDTAAHIILWQVAHLGMHDTQPTNKISILVDYLQRYYASTQPLCIYEAAFLPTQKSRQEWIKLNELMSANIRPISTLYFPPSSAKKLSEKYLKILEINLKNYSPS